MSEWIEWKGGECPVPRGTLIDVRYRDGGEMYGRRALECESWGRDASSSFWGRLNIDSDITAYRPSNLFKPSASTLEEAYEDAARPISDNALGTQVSGNHYLQFEIQPVAFINANNLDFLQGNVIKYITRHKLKGKRADVEKAIHCCKLILEMQYGEK